MRFYEFEAKALLGEAGYGRRKAAAYALPDEAGAHRCVGGWRRSC